MFREELTECKKKCHEKQKIRRHSNQIFLRRQQRPRDSKRIPVSVSLAIYLQFYSQSSQRQVLDVLDANDRLRRRSKYSARNRRETKAGKNASCGGSLQVKRRSQDEAADSNHIRVEKYLNKSRWRFLADASRPGYSCSPSISAKNIYVRNWWRSIEELARGKNGCGTQFRWLCKMVLPAIWNSMSRRENVLYSKSVPSRASVYISTRRKPLYKETDAIYL